MHSRRLASMLLGGWLVASLLLDFVVIQNFRSVDRFLAAPDAVVAQQIKSVGGQAEARVFLRHLAAGENQYLFEQWEISQTIVGLALLGVMIFLEGDVPKSTLVFAGLMLVIVGIDRFFLTPQVTRLGQLLDYPAQPGSNPRLFWTLHGIYSGLELLKIALGLACAATLLIRRRDPGRFVREHDRLNRRAAEAPAG